MAEVIERSPEPSQQSLALRPAPSTTNSFAIPEYQYKPLDRGEIRMLILLPGEFDSPLQGYISQEHFDPSDCKFSYEALSYVWGSQADQKPFHVLECSSQGSSAKVKTLKIGQNLESALRHLRQTDEARTVWCDAICINQNDVDERGAQVQRMGRIYSHAEQVVVWLGPETDDLYRAVQIMKFLGSVYYFNPKEFKIRQYSENAVRFGHEFRPLPFSLEEWKSVYDFFDLPWFRRLWVRQEIILAKGSAIFLVGKQALAWNSFCSACLYIISETFPAPFDEAQGQEMAASLSRCTSLFIFFTDIHVLVTLRVFNDCECLDPRDKIYGILGLHEELSIEPDYEKDYRDVYTDFTRTYLSSARDIQVLIFCNTADDVCWLRPSWAPDFSKPVPLIGYSASVRAAMNAARHHCILSDDSLKILAVRCGTISRCSSVMPLNVVPSSYRAIVKSWILDAFRNRTGDLSQSWIDDIVSTIVLGNIVENYPNCAYTLSEATDILFQDLDWYSPRKPLDEDRGNALVQSFSSLGIGGSILATTTDGKYALSVGATRSRDEIVVIPGCSSPLVLRKIGDGRYRVVGPCFMQSLMRSEALLGQLPQGWEMRFERNSEKVRLTDADGQSQSEDPRLGDLLPGWKVDRENEKGQRLFWNELYNYSSWYDPRLTPENLAARGIKFEELIIV